MNFRLKVLVEWTASKEETRLLSLDKKTALYNSAISIYLTPTIHEFDFDESGGVTFSINYLAYIEDYFSQRDFDVFASLTADKKVRDLSYSFLRSEECNVADQVFETLREADEVFISNTNTVALQTIVQKLRKRNSIYYLSITKKQMRDWLLTPWDNTSYINKDAIDDDPSIDEGMVEAATTAATKGQDVDKSAFQLSLISNSDLVSNTAFFYLSDLIDVAMSNIEDSLTNQQKLVDTKYFSEVIEKVTTGGEELKNYISDKMSKKTNPKVRATMEQFSKIRVVLGPMEITPYGKSLYSERAISCTVGDIPISLTYFLDFMSEKVLSNDFIQYPFSKFVKDIVNDCIRNFINADGCFAVNASQKVSLNSTAVLAYNMIEGDADDDLSNLILENAGAYSSKNCLLANRVPKNKFPILKISGPSGDERKTLGVDKMRNYFIFSVGRRYPIDSYTGNVEVDSENGVFHYVLGSNRGMIKNISLDKTSTPGLKELRFEQEGFDGLEQLREVYNANVTTFLNPQTFPGTYIYIEPKGFDPTSTEDLSKYGIGGYYMITKTQHQITPGNSETVLNAAWVASKGGKITRVEGKEKRNVKGSQRVAKCRVDAIQKSVDKR